MKFKKSWNISLFFFSIMKPAYHQWNILFSFHLAFKDGWNTHWNRNVKLLTKNSFLCASKVVILITFNAANFAKMSFPVQWWSCPSQNIVAIPMLVQWTLLSASWSKWWEYFWIFFDRSEYNDLCLCYVNHSYLNGVDIFVSLPMTPFEITIRLIKSFFNG